MSEPEVQLISFPYRGRTHYTIRITTPYKRVEIGVSSTGRNITVCPVHRHRETDDGD